jgi:hypothetical protein
VADLTSVSRGLIGGVVFGASYFVVSQLAALVYLLLAAAFGWQVRGYHEPADHEWWSWLLFVVWVAGFAVAVWWGASRFRSRLEPGTSSAP